MLNQNPLGDKVTALLVDNAVNSRTIQNAQLKKNASEATTKHASQIGALLQP